MSLASRLYRGEVSYDFIGHRKRWYAISGVVIVICIASMIFRGFTFGIDFKGGAEFDFPSNGHTVTQAPLGAGRHGGQRRGRAVAELVAAEHPHPDQADHRGADREGHREPSSRSSAPRNVSSTSFGSSWGSSVTTKSVEGLIVFLVLVMIYIAFRFEPKMAAGGDHRALP